MAELISDNAEQRAFTAASMNTLQCERCFLPSFILLPLDHKLTACFYIQIHSQLGYHWFGSSRFTNLMVRLVYVFFIEAPSY